MKVTYYLIVSREGVRSVKRRPSPRIGEWLVRLTVDYPPVPQPLDIDITLPAQEGEVAVDAVVEDA
jgi:hypothetical protein